MKQELDKNNRRAIFSRRLQNARKICGLSQAELVDRMEKLYMELPILYKAVSTTAIERYENGVMFPESDMIMGTLAEALNTRIDDLLRPFTVKVDFSKFEFRKKPKLGKKAEKAIKLKIQQRIEKYVEIEQIAGEKKQFDRNVLADRVVVDEASARQAALHLREEWNLGKGPIAQPILVLESHGVKVIEVEEDPELFDGTSNTVEGIPVLVLNKNDTPMAQAKYQMSEERRRLTLFHELGHQVMTFGEGLDKKQKEELCNVFANEMLIPGDTFKEIVGKKRSSISYWELKDIQKEFGISVRALMMKAAQLGIISKSNLKQFCISMNKNKDMREKLDKSEIHTQHTSRFNRLVYRMLASEVITTSKAALLLDISVSQLIENLNCGTAGGDSR